MGFVHVDESTVVSCDGLPCFAISPALRDDFLPDRRSIMQDFMDTSCNAVCEQDNPAALQALLSGPATVGLPSGDIPLQQLLNWEHSLEADLAQRTLGNRPRSVH